MNTVSSSEHQHRESNLILVSSDPNLDYSLANYLWNALGGHPNDKAPEMSNETKDETITKALGYLSLIINRIIHEDDQSGLRFLLTHTGQTTHLLEALLQKLEELEEVISLREIIIIAADPNSIGMDEFTKVTGEHVVEIIAKTPEAISRLIAKINPVVVEKYLSTSKLLLDEFETSKATIRAELENNQVSDKLSYLIIKIGSALFEYKLSLVDYSSIKNKLIDFLIEIEYLTPVINMTAVTDEERNKNILAMQRWVHLDSSLPSLL